ncbi:hypothetical protein [uncultured Methanospirillum sp.]|uniref:hypothetical protein n=1 Tax=uncultured Methanospirillum sp. TaxID=262503 RepID=UPI0029C9A8A3|nr:hypothetical protein [uncultured Methanospirillum sp.]
MDLEKLRQNVKDVVRKMLDILRQAMPFYASHVNMGKWRLSRLMMYYLPFKPLSLLLLNNYKIH